MEWSGPDWNVHSTFLSCSMISSFANFFHTEVEMTDGRQRVILPRTNMKMKNSRLSLLSKKNNKLQDIYNIIPYQKNYVCVYVCVFVYVSTNTHIYMYKNIWLQKNYVYVPTYIIKSITQKGLKGYTPHPLTVINSGGNNT